MNKIYVFIICIILISCTVSQQAIDIPAPEQMKKTTPGRTVTIGLAGDVMLGRLVNDQIGIAGVEYPWGDMKDELQSTDLNVINLENAITKSKKKIMKVFNFKLDPHKVQTLKEARIDVVTVANNHILDFGLDGLVETIKTLDKARIKHVGAGINSIEAKKPVIVKIKDVTIGIMGYTDNEPGWQASATNPGTNYIQVGNIKQIKEDIKELRERVDILILTIHWGPNMLQRPLKSHQEFAHQLIDAGVDIIHGHSSHLFQGIEVYKDKVILYDTGDFVDDYYVTPELRNDQSFFYKVKVEKDGIKAVELVPVLISQMQVNKATGDDYSQAVEKVITLSKEFNTNLEEKSGQVVLVK